MTEISNAYTYNGILSVKIERRLSYARFVNMSSGPAPSSMFQANSPNLTSRPNLKNRVLLSNLTSVNRQLGETLMMVDHKYNKYYKLEHQLMVMNNFEDFLKKLKSNLICNHNYIVINYIKNVINYTK